MPSAARSRGGSRGAAAGAALPQVPPPRRELPRLASCPLNLSSPLNGPPQCSASGLHGGGDPSRPGLKVRAFSLHPLSLRVFSSGRFTRAQTPYPKTCARIPPSDAFCSLVAGCPGEEIPPRGAEVCQPAGTSVSSAADGPRPSGRVETRGNWDTRSPCTPGPGLGWRRL